MAKRRTNPPCATIKASVTFSTTGRVGPAATHGVLKMKTVLLASAAMFALTGAAFAGAAHPGKVAHSVPHHYVHGLPPGTVTLYDQNDNDNGVGIVSDDFDSGSFDSYDSQIADDFKVPKGTTWKVKEVDVS